MVLIVAGFWKCPGEGLVMPAVSAWIVQTKGALPDPLGVVTCAYPVKVYVTGAALAIGIVAETRAESKADRTRRAPRHTDTVCFHVCFTKPSGISHVIMWAAFHHKQGPSCTATLRPIVFNVV
jgi:hypothetical protein